MGTEFSTGEAEPEAQHAANILFIFTGYYCFFATIAAKQIH